MWATDYADFTDWDSSATNNTNHTNILPRNILPRITQITQKGRANAKDLFEQIKGTSILVLIRVIRGICGYVGHELHKSHEYFATEYFATDYTDYTERTSEC